MFLHKKGARQPDALNPDNWAIDAYAFSIAANRVFVSRLFMDLTTNILYPEWTACLKERQPKTLIVRGRNDLKRLRLEADVHAFWQPLVPTYIPDLGRSVLRGLPFQSPCTAREKL